MDETTQKDAFDFSTPGEQSVSLTSSDSYDSGSSNVSLGEGGGTYSSPIDLDFFNLVKNEDGTISKKGEVEEKTPKSFTEVQTISTKDDDAYDEDTYEYFKNSLEDEGSDFNINSEEAEEELDKAQRRLERSQKVKGGSSTSNVVQDIPGISSWSLTPEVDYDAQIEENQKDVNKWQTAVDRYSKDREAMQKYVDVYKDRYSEPKEVKSKEETTLDSAKETHKKLIDARDKAYSKATSLSQKLLGESLDFEELEEKRQEVTEDAQSLLSKGAEEITKITKVNPKLKKGQSQDFGVFTIIHNSDDSWTLRINDREYSNPGKGTDNVYTNVLDPSPNPGSVSSKLTNLNKILNSKDVVQVIEECREAEKNADNALENINSAYSGITKAKQNRLNELNKAYKSGKLSPVEYANKIRNNGTLAFGEESKNLSDIATPGSETMEFVENWYEKYTNELKGIDVDAISDEKGVSEAGDKVEDITRGIMSNANAELSGLIEKYQGLGMNLKEIRDTGDWIKASQNIYDIAQELKDTCNRIREKSNSLGMKKEYEDNTLKKLGYDASKFVASFDKTFNEGRIVDSLDKTEAYSITRFLESLDAAEAASEALMKSAAFEGAKDTPGSEYVEAWKNQKGEKLSVKEVLGLIGTGTLQTALLFAPIPSAAKAGVAVSMANSTVNTASEVYAANTSNKEKMFGQGLLDKGYRSHIEKANIGDPKATSTYAYAATGLLNIAGGITNLFSGDVAAAGTQISVGVNDINKVAKGGLEGNLDTTIKNVYEGLKAYDEVNGTNYAEPLKGSWTVTETSDSPVTSGFGTVSTTEDDETLKGDDKYSGYREQAVNSNVANEYNAGLKEDVSDVVSDKYCKVFKTILAKEPEYIRKVLIAIPKMHSETEWR